MVEVASAVDALGAAIEFQQAMAKANREQPKDTAIVFRIGLHLGDLLVDGDDLTVKASTLPHGWGRRRRRVGARLQS